MQPTASPSRTNCNGINVDQHLDVCLLHQQKHRSDTLKHLELSGKDIPVSFAISDRAFQHILNIYTNKVYVLEVQNVCLDTFVVFPRIEGNG